MQIGHHFITIIIFPLLPVSQWNDAHTLISLMRVWKGVSSGGLVSITSWIALVHLHASSLDAVYRLRDVRRLCRVIFQQPGQGIEKMLRFNRGLFI